MTKLFRTVIALALIATGMVANAATIGNSLTGASDRTISNQIWKGISIASFPGGTLNSASARLQATDGTWQMAVLSSSGTVLAVSSTRTDVGAFGNYTFTFSGQSISAQDIILAVAVDSQSVAGFVFYDNDTYDGLTSDSFYVLTASTVGLLDDSTRDYSLQLDYTAAGGSTMPAKYHHYRRMKQ